MLNSHLERQTKNTKIEKTIVKKKKKKSESDRETAYGFKILTHHRMTVTWRYDQNKELNKSFETVFIHVHVQNIIIKQNNKTANEI